jgi:hypothetical protein
MEVYTQAGMPKKRVAQPDRDRTDDLFHAMELSKT